MKRFLIAAALASLPVLAHAQTIPTPSFYGTLGYADDDLSHVNLSAIQGRLGARFGSYFGVEGEVSTGISSDHRDFSGVRTRLKLENQEAAYAVGFYPVSPKFDLLARIGYGGETLKAKALGVSGSDSDNSWNYGVGGQYHFDEANGIRADYTRKEFQGNDRSANVWAVSYVRKF